MTHQSTWSLRQASWVIILLIRWGIRNWELCRSWDTEWIDRWSYEWKTYNWYKLAAERRSKKIEYGVNEKIEKVRNPEIVTEVRDHDDWESKKYDDRESEKWKGWV